MEKYLLLLLILILETSLQRIERQISTDQNNDGGPFDPSISECVVPAPDAVTNGKFEVREDYLNIHLPDGKLHSYDLRITCNQGYKPVPQGRAPVVICIVNRTRDELPECLPTCKRSTPEIFSCGIGTDNKESKCLLPSGETPSSGVTPSLGLTSPSLKTAKDYQCGRTVNFGKSSVSKGVEAKREDAPWHAGIYTKSTRPYMQICGGTIVSTNVVISAAHCFWTSIEKKLPAENFAVAVGKIYRPWDDPNDKNVQKSDILEIRIPPRFHGSATNFQDDIALLMLKEVLTFTVYIVPACLDFDYDFDENQLANGKIGRVVGWGLTSEDGAPSPILNKAELPIVNVEKCTAEADPAFLSSITSDKICAGYMNGTAVCRGDSGGGLAFQEFIDDRQRYFLRGLVSTAPTSDHLCNVYAVATFTHIIRHERFIRNAISQSPPPNIVPEYQPPLNPPVTTILNKSSGLGSDRPLFGTTASIRPLNVTPGLDKKPINEGSSGFEKRPVNGDTTGLDNKLLNSTPSSFYKPLTYMSPEMKPYQTTGSHESTQAPCRPEERPQLIGISSYEKPGPYVKPGCNEKPGSEIKPQINDGQHGPNNPNSGINNAFVHEKIYRLPISEKPIPSISSNSNPINNDKPVSDDNVPVIYAIPIVYNKAVVYEKNVIYEGPVTYMSHVSDKSDEFGSDVTPILYDKAEMNDRLTYNEKLLTNEEYKMYNRPTFYDSPGTYARSISNEKPIYNGKSVTDNKSTSSERLESNDDYSILFDRPVVYKESVIYEKSVTYKKSKLYYDKIQNQFQRDVVASKTELNNQGVKIEIGIANNDKDTPKSEAKDKSRNVVNSSDVKVQNEEKIKGNKDILKPDSIKDQSNQNNNINVPTGPSSNQANLNKNISDKTPNIPSSIIIDDYDDEHYVNPSKPHLFDKDHPINQAINLPKPDQKQPTHWHPLIPESWQENFHGQNFNSKNPDSGKDGANSGNDKDSNFDDFVPEGFKLFRQHGLSHQSTNILINTHNGPVTIGDISSVVNFYYKSANRTIPNMGE